MRKCDTGMLILGHEHLGHPSIEQPPGSFGDNIDTLFAMSFKTRMSFQTGMPQYRYM